MNDYETHSAGEITLAQVDKEILKLAARLREIHGTITIASETRGIHLYMASPEVLEREGDKELKPPGHLCINADKYLRIGR